MFTRSFGEIHYSPSLLSPPLPFLPSRFKSPHFTTANFSSPYSSSTAFSSAFVRRSAALQLVEARAVHARGISIGSRINLARNHARLVHRFMRAATQAGRERGEDHLERGLDGGDTRINCLVGCYVCKRIVMVMRAEGSSVSLSPLVVSSLGWFVSNLKGDGISRSSG